MMNYVEILATHTLPPSNRCAEENQKKHQEKCLINLKNL
jgi:hypothetical protein